MGIEWKVTEPVVRKPTKQISYKGITLDVGENERDSSMEWCWFMMSFGSNKPSSNPNNADEWSREAIARARALLDEFERRLDEP